MNKGHSNIKSFKRIINFKVMSNLYEVKSIMIINNLKSNNNIKTNKNLNTKISHNPNTNQTIKNLKGIDHKVKITIYMQVITNKLKISHFMITNLIPDTFPGLNGPL